MNGPKIHREILESSKEICRRRLRPHFSIARIADVMASSIASRLIQFFRRKFMPRLLS